MSPRLTVLGLDAANPDLLRRWMADGTLPHLAALARRGVTGTVESVEGFFIGATWPSFQTGRSPAEHGVHYLAQIRPGTYDYHAPYADEGCPGEAFWSRLSRQGHRVAVLDVPLSRLDPGLKGVQTVEWGGHDSIFGFRAHPHGLATALLSRHGPHPVGPVCDGARSSVADWRGFRDALVTGARVKAEITREFRRREEWALLVQVFTEAHCAGHQMWHLHDPTHPGHDTAVTNVLGDPLREVYRAIDAAIGTLGLPEDELVLVTSLHGMAGYVGAGFLLPDVLTRLGVAVPEEAVAPSATVASTLRAGARRAWHLLPVALRDRLRPLRQRFVPDPPPGPRRLGMDVRRSRCFVVGNGAPVSGIRLNLAGREPAGCLEPGEAAEAFVDDLAAALLEIRDERTGRPAISAVRRTAHLHRGAALDRLPDLLVEWADEVATGSMHVAGGAGATVTLSSPRIGTVSGQNWYGRTGDHRAGGLYLLAGPGIPKGAEGRTLRVADLAPAIEATVLAHAEAGLAARACP